MTKEITHTWPRGLCRAWVVIEPGVLEFMLEGCVVYPDGGMIGFSKSSLDLALKATDYDYMGMGEFFPSANTLAKSDDGDIRMINTPMTIYDSDDSEHHWLQLDYCTVMLSLGITDSVSEQWVYEGDIFKYSYAWGIGEGDKKVFLDGKDVAYGLIEWDERRCGFVKQPHSIIFDKEAMVFEVIGNRFNNKDLLDTLVFRK